LWSKTQLIICDNHMFSLGGDDNYHTIFFSHFLMLHYNQTSQKHLRIKWQQISETYQNHLERQINLPPKTKFLTQRLE
jgi:hypothetical protein